ncbi:MAG: hypothetical protein A2Y25_04005 [Candidatus Melainabacteria bacterium GWF2_37_15]|nr:MAG: hypothetical protein A2Y25_04005 [Candidatus Melainabacteria bacterium GWF2_37_15]
MIIKEFSKYIQNFSADIPAVILLSRWMRERISKTHEDNVDRVMQKEIALLRNKRGFFLMFGRSDSGRKLLESLYEFALSYDNHKFSKWVHKLKASDFK